MSLPLLVKIHTLLVANICRCTPAVDFASDAPANGIPNNIARKPSRDVHLNG